MKTGRNEMELLGLGEEAMVGHEGRSGQAHGWRDQGFRD